MLTRSDTYVTGLIGAGIGTSLSPPLHEREAAELGLRYAYRTLDIDVLGAAGVGELLARAREPGYDGLNVTHPCKQLVLEHLDELSDGRRGARRGQHGRDPRRPRDRATTPTPPGSRRAFDAGCRAPALGPRRAARRGRRGRGRGARAARLGAGELVIFDVDDAERAAALARAVGGARSRTPARPRASRRARARDADRHGGPSRHRRSTRACCTPGCGWPTSSTGRWRPSCCARRAQRGCRTLDGGGMVVFQAAASFELFTGRRPDRERMLRHFAELTA